MIINPLHQCFYLSFLCQYAQQLGIDIPLDKLNSNKDIIQLNDYAQSSHLALTKQERKQIFNAIEFHFKENITHYKNLKSIGILEEVL
jgi:hypothetical protein